MFTFSATLLARPVTRRESSFAIETSLLPLSEWMIFCPLRPTMSSFLTYHTPIPLSKLWLATQSSMAPKSATTKEILWSWLKTVLRFSPLFSHLYPVCTTKFTELSKLDSQKQPDARSGCSTKDLLQRRLLLNTLFTPVAAMTSWFSARSKHFLEDALDVWLLGQLQSMLPYLTS